MTKLYVDYPNAGEYPTAMFFIPAWGQGLFATDTEEGSIFYLFKLNNAQEQSKAGSALGRKYLST